MATSHAKRLGASVLLSLMLTAGLAAGALGASPASTNSRPGSPPAMSTTSSHVNGPVSSAMNAHAASTPSWCKSHGRSSKLTLPGCSPKRGRLSRTMPAGLAATWSAAASPATADDATHFIKGKVTTTGGTPLRSIGVEAYSSDNDLYAWTGIDGTYSLAVPIGYYSVFFFDPSGVYFAGYYSSSGFTLAESAATPVLVKSSDVTGISVHLPTGHHIKGKVTSTGGTPLPNIKVEAQSDNYDLWCFTASDGTYSLAVPADSYTVSFDDLAGVYIGGYYSSGGLTLDGNAATPVTVGTADVTGINAHLGTGHKITGTVTGTGGTPLRNVVVEAYSDVFDGFAATADDGTYSLAVPSGTYTVDFTDPSDTYFPSFYRTGGLTIDENLATPVPVGSSNATGISMQLGTGHKITGTITGTGGTPLENIQIEAYSDLWHDSTYTAPDGTYSIALPAGDYTVAVSDLSGAYFDGYYSSSGSGGFTLQETLATPVPVIAADAPHIDVTLGTGHLIKGTVTTTGGTPLGNIFVDAYSDGYEGNTWTAADGTYSIAVPAGTYIVSFGVPNGAYLEGYYATGGFTTDENLCTPVPVNLLVVPDISVHLPTGHHIKGTVTTEDGTPLANIEVDTDGSGFQDSAFTAIDGTYSVIVAPGPTTVCFTDPSLMYLDGCYSSDGFTDEFSATPVMVGSADVSGIDVQIPSALDYLILSPDGATIASGASQAFTAEGYDALDDDLGDVTSTTTFTIDGGGSCTGAVCTSSVAGEHDVTGTNGDAEGDALLEVTGPTLSTYHPITPVRVLDTRKAIGLWGKLTAGTPRTFKVTGHNGIPAGATAITGNATVVNSSAASSIYLGPTAIAHPSTFTLSFNKGQVANRGVTVALSATGTLSVTYRATTGTTDLVLDVSGYFSPGTSGDTYHPLTPARVLDTRSGVGLKAALKANTPATFTVWGHGGVPKGAKAVTGNVTVVNPTNSWAIYLGPKPLAKPGSSTINFTRAQVQGNSLTVALSSTGTLSATYMSSKGATTDLVFDVTGYYTADATGARYVPLAPATLLNTRTGIGLSGKVHATTPRTFTVRGHAGVPATATGITGVVAVVNQTAPWALFVGPSPVAKPTTSSLNFGKHDICSNGLTVALSSKGTLSVTYMSGKGWTTDVVLFVTGYFVK